MEQDEKIITKVLKLERERKEWSMSEKNAFIHMFSKKSREDNAQVEEIFEMFTSSNEHYETLYAYVQNKKYEYRFLKRIKIKKNESYPEALRFNDLVVQIINHIFNVMNKEKWDATLKYLKRMQPVIEKVEERKDGFLDMTIRPFLNIDLGEHIQILINDQPADVQQLPFYYHGDVKDIKCIVTNPYTKESLTYEGR